MISLSGGWFRQSKFITKKGKIETIAVCYGLIMHYGDSNHEIIRSSKKKYNNIKDH